MLILRAYAGDTLQIGTARIPIARVGERSAQLGDTLLRAGDGVWVGAARVVISSIKRTATGRGRVCLAIEAPKEVEVRLWAS